jgi:hypothetical protein
MPTINFEIDQWFQDAIQKRLIEHVRKTVSERVGTEWVVVENPTRSPPNIDVKWRALHEHGTIKTYGTESFTLAQVMKIAMEEP